MTTGGSGSLIPRIGRRISHENASGNVSSSIRTPRHTSSTKTRSSASSRIPTRARRPRLDTGHHAYRGGDPVAFIKKHHARIPYLHLKSVRPEMITKVEAENIPFAIAVGDDMFCEPSEGAVDFIAFRDVLREIDYTGYAIVEQDMYPAPFDKPLPIAKRTRAYLREIGIGCNLPSPASGRGAGGGGYPAVSCSAAAKASTQDSISASPIGVEMQPIMLGDMKIPCASMDW